MRKIVLASLIFLIFILFLNGCSSENNYSGSLGDYELLEARVLESVNENGQSLLALKIQYINTTEASHRPIDSIRNDLIIINREDEFELDCVLFNNAMNNAYNAGMYDFTTEDIKMINNGSFNVEPGASINVMVTAGVSKECIDYLFLRDKNENYLNGTKYNKKIEVAE